jgi:polar amino acid transport system substrate-binding protein
MNAALNMLQLLSHYQHDRWIIMKYSKPYLLLLMIVLLVSFSVSSCAPTADTTLERAQNQGKIRIGFANDIPYGYVDATGRITGEAPEIARSVLYEMGITELEGVYTEFGSLIQDLKLDRFDIIAAGMFITPKRCLEIIYSEPTYKVGQSFAVLSGNPKNLHSYEDVANNPEVTLAVMAGAVEGDYASAIGVRKVQLLVVPDPPTGLALVKTGEADALALTSLAILKLVKADSTGQVDVAAPFSDPVINGKAISGYGAFGFRQGDVTLRDEFNKYLIPFIGSNKHLAIMQQFGFSDLPGNITAKDLCKE